MSVKRAGREQERERTMSVDVFEYRGASITVDYCDWAENPLTECYSGSDDPKMFICRDDRNSAAFDDHGAGSAYYRLLEDKERAMQEIEHLAADVVSEYGERWWENGELFDNEELLGLIADEFENLFDAERGMADYLKFAYVEYDAWGWPTFTVIVDKATIPAYLVGENHSETIENLRPQVWMYAMWAEGLIYTLSVDFPDGACETMGGIYFKGGSPVEEEIIELVNDISDDSNFVPVVESVDPSAHSVHDVIEAMEDAGLSERDINRTLRSLVDLAKEGV